VAQGCRERYRHARNGDVSALRRGTCLTRTGSPATCGQNPGCSAGPAECPRFGQAEVACKSAQFQIGRRRRRDRSSDSPRELRLSCELGAPKETAFAGLFLKRLMGFEPTTFCMASRKCVSRSAPISPANAAVLVWRCRAPIPRLSPGVHASLGTEEAPEFGLSPEYVANEKWSLAWNHPVDSSPVLTRVDLDRIARRHILCSLASVRIMQPLARDPAGTRPSARRLRRRRRDPVRAPTA
jgi:hypothetical protein